MLDPNEKLYELLVGEKNLADSQIGGYGDLSLKVLAFFGGVVAVLGWLYSDRGIGASHPIGAAAICVAVALLGCGVILQGVTTYGFTLGYIQYKHETLNRAFVRVASIGPRYPFNHVRAWWNGAARRPVLLATRGFVVLHLLLTAGLIGFASLQFYCHDAWWFMALAVAGFATLAYTFFVEVALYRAIEQVFTVQMPYPPEDDEKSDISRAG